MQKNEEEDEAMVMYIAKKKLPLQIQNKPFKNNGQKPPYDMS
jgi:hypothetical protein